ncbi:unnamed protein product (macronuclear) [Paramecium tetraurelia]|uniref:Protein kinase domain-containing protein n=1 Tax=Paramecium tetraurelia TaxID=5888 RepID=A0CKG6_PARTE|nr:uncharacterized protein GSPATT00000997001 [Paramecium tetraurelia]CAK71283.1 unnamed protein product [Paramecium tetraurelia]|eukprot:XP_001438680.1 hypothetical protein (macronuclear) [Paramecium tetraurelia strain d4-2]
MMQDSLFAESFWNPISLTSFSHDDDYNVFQLHSENTPVVIRVIDGQLISSSQQLDLFQTYITLDEKGVTLQNQFGQITYSGPQLQQFYELINKLCMHLDIHNHYQIEKQTHQLDNFEIFQSRDKMTGILKSIKKYSKNLGKQYLKDILSYSNYEILYEDDQYLYLVIQYLNEQNIQNLAFEQSFFGLLKLLYNYHKKGLALNHFSESNTILLDENYNMEILDNSQLKRITQDYQNDVLKDVQIIKSYLIQQFPHKQDTLLDVVDTTFNSVQELLFHQCFINYFGERNFFVFLNAQPYQQLGYLSSNPQLNLLETFNTIRSSIMDSSDESEDVQLINQFNFCQSQFEDSPMLSPQLKPKHQSRLSSRQVVLETLLNEHIITPEQFQQFYKEEDFQNEQEINEFSEMLSKEIENSQLTTPNQSESTATCPNTVIIHSKKNVVNRICDIIHEAQQEFIEATKNPYDVNKVQNVRKNLFNLH